jgi:hypothetical protein
MGVKLGLHCLTNIEVSEERVMYRLTTTEWRCSPSMIIGGVETGYGLDDRGVGVRVLVGPRSFSSPRRPDRL